MIRMKKKLLMLVMTLVMAGAFMFPVALSCPAHAANTTRNGVTANWQAWGNNSLPTGGYYYLTKNITATPAKKAQLPAADTHLDLNGYTLTFKPNGSSLINLEYNSGSFYLYDTSAAQTGVMTISHTSSDYHSAIWVRNTSGKGFFMYGGTITGFETCGAVRIHTGKFEMYGGTITGNYSTSEGGGVKIYDGSTFVMAGGTITGNSAAVGGGGVSLASTSHFTKTGGEIAGNTSPQQKELPIDFSYTVNMNNGGGTGTNSITATYDEGMPTITPPTRVGYTFEGYFDASADGTKYYNADGTSAKNWDKVQTSSTLYARWTANTSEFTLNRNGGYGGDNSVQATYDDDMPTISKPSRSGYIFNGYWDEENNEKIFDASGDPMQEVSDFTDDKTLYACWERTEEIANEKLVDENLSGTEEELAESVRDEIDLIATDENGNKALEGLFNREDGDTISHELYYRMEVLGASEDAIRLDIKPCEQPVEHGENVGPENELQAEDGMLFRMRIKVPESMQDNGCLYLKHIKEDGTAYYETITIQRGSISFKNTHGFSEFDISTEKFDDPKFMGKSLLLSDELGVNFYMHIPDKYLGGEMHFAITGKGTCTPENTSGEYVESSDEYKFTCNINALQMAEKITATYVKDDYMVSEEYSVVEYLELAKQKGSPEMQELASDIYSYGYYAQQYLSEENDFELGEGDDKYAEMQEPETSPDTSVDLSDYELINAANGNTNIVGVTKALVLDSKITLKLFCELSNDSTYNESNKPAVTVDKKTSDPSKITFSTSGDSKFMVIEIPEITVGLMGHTYRVVIDDSYTIKTSALSYAYSLMQKDDEGAKKLAATLYECYESAMGYVGSDMEQTTTTYTINYCQGNGNDKAGTEKTQIVNCDEDVNFFDGDTYNAPDGKVFVGWSTSLDGQTKTYLPGEKVRNLVKPGRTINLYAQYHKPVGGKIWYVDNTSADSATYTFYDERGKKIIADTNDYEDLDSAMYYEQEGSSGFDKYYVLATVDGNPESDMYLIKLKCFDWKQIGSNGTQGRTAIGQGKPVSEIHLGRHGNTSSTFWNVIKNDIRVNGLNECKDWFIPTTLEMSKLYNNCTDKFAITSRELWTCTELYGGDGWDHHHTVSNFASSRTGFVRRCKWHGSGTNGNIAIDALLIRSFGQ